MKILLPISTKILLLIPTKTLLLIPTKTPLFLIPMKTKMKISLFRTLIPPKTTPRSLWRT